MNSPGGGIWPSRPVIAGPIPVSVALAFLLAFAPSAGSQTAAPGDQPVFATESSARELQTRIEELERRLGASALLELAARVDRLTKEVRELRDRAEVQARTIKALQGRQQDLYAELDRLAQRLARPAPEAETGGTAPDTGAAPSVPSAEPGADTAAATPGEKPGTGEGESGETGPAAPDDAASGDPEPAPASPSPYDPVEEQAQYQLAFDLLSEGRFERAANAFTDFLADFPESRYRDNARFWKGECLYALRRFEPALEEFRSLVASHPDSSRIPGARLKIGFILHELGRSEEAAQELRALVEAAPDSSEAKLARDRLERLQ